MRSYDDLVPLHCVAFGGHDECARVLLKCAAAACASAPLPPSAPSLFALLTHRALLRRYGADPSLTLPGDEKASPTGLLAMLGCSGGDACGAGAADATDGAGAAKSDGDAGGATPASDGSGGAPPSGLFNYVCSLVIPN